MKIYPIMLDFGICINVVARNIKEANRIIEDTFNDYRVQERFINKINMRR